MRDAWRSMLMLALGGAAAGAGGRGLLGLRNLLVRPPKPSPQAAVPEAIPVHMPFPDPHKPPKEKQAFSALNSAGGPAWWQIPVGTGASLGGLYGGWKLVDWLMNANKKREMRAQLAAARKKYEQALKTQYEASMLAKSGADGGAQPTLDHLCEAVQRFHMPQEKQATNPLANALTNIVHGGLGTYLTLLAGITGLSGYGAYNMTKDRGKQRALEAAIKRRARLRTLPQPVIAYPDYEQPKKHLPWQTS